MIRSLSFPITSQLSTLTNINLDDLVASFGWQNQPLFAAPLRLLFSHPARKFAQQMVEYDDLVGQGSGEGRHHDGRRHRPDGSQALHLLKRLGDT